MLRFFERRLEPTGRSPEMPPPVLGSPHAVLRFYWHCVRQVAGPIAAVFTTSFFVAISDAAIPVCIGRIVWLVSAQDPQTIWDRAGLQLLAMAVLLLVVRPTAHFAQAIIVNQMLIPGLTNMVRWQNHWHVVRQGWTVFQNDFSGRIAARVMQTGPALRESAVLSILGIWYIVVYGTSAVALLAAADWRLSLPILLWFCVYGGGVGARPPAMRGGGRPQSPQGPTPH